MALVAVASAKGAPGATTTAVALAAVHPGPSLVADVDPAGGDLVWRYTSVDGRPLDTGRGLLSLAAVVRRGRGDLAPHLQAIAGGLPVLAGVTSPEQVTGLGPVWPQLAQALGSVAGVEVFADCGRVAAGSPAMPVLAAADAVVLVTRAQVEALAHLRERVRVLADQAGAGTVRPPIGVVVVAPEKDHRPVVSDVQRLLDAAGLAGRVLGAVAWDVRGARLLAGAGRGSAGKTPLVRSVRALSTGVRALAAEGVALRGGSALAEAGVGGVQVRPGASSGGGPAPGRSTDRGSTDRGSAGPGPDGEVSAAGQWVRSWTRG
jgi:MinD-like ATPase involved in chromosome partitioning or flagellar assembly